MKKIILFSSLLLFAVAFCAAQSPSQQEVSRYASSPEKKSSSSLNQPELKKFSAENANPNNKLATHPELYPAELKREDYYEGEKQKSEKQNPK